ncbi:MAG TPA: GTPase ObgE [Blastocatellia bacterium]|nr:GTPase ObgE [Blastocatellia bacterium]
MKFLDRARIILKGGDGGNGVTAFRREKFVPRGGPSGGDGGNGGSVYMESTDQLNTLLQFRFNPEYRARNGSHGEGSNRHGKDGDDLEVKVPVGTIATDSVTGELIHDFSMVGDRVCIAPGGTGGKGNARFATSTNRAPRHHQAGRPGTAITLSLELKLIADAGLVGFPNAGKSTLISRISAARPKIADYPFTTLEPNLGLVDRGEGTGFVVADIPGLIEGAHQGAGLGLHFLRHIERTKVLLHVVDVSSGSGRDPVEDLQIITAELRAYKPELLDKPQIVAASKADAMDDPTRLGRLETFCGRLGMDVILISSVTGLGLDRLVDAVGRLVDFSANRRDPAVPESDSLSNSSPGSLSDRAGSTVMAIDVAAAEALPGPRGNGSEA